MSAMPAWPARAVDGRPTANQAKSDPLVRALAQYVEALNRRYPDGPAPMHCDGLARRANMLPVNETPASPAA